MFKYLRVVVSGPQNIGGRARWPSGQIFAEGQIFGPSENFQIEWSQMDIQTIINI